MRKRVKWTGAALVLGVLLAVSGIAWACTRTPIVTIQPGAGPAGVPLTVMGKAFSPGPIQIRWNSVDGRTLASTAGPSFSVTVPIPADAEPGVYYLVATQSAVSAPGGGALSDKAAAVIQVKAGRAGQADGAARGANDGLWSGIARGSAEIGQGSSTTPASSPHSGVFMLGASLLSAGLSLAAWVVLVKAKTRASKSTAKWGSGS